MVKRENCLRQRHGALGPISAAMLSTTSCLVRNSKQCLQLRFTLKILQNCLSERISSYRYLVPIVSFSSCHDVITSHTDDANMSTLPTLVRRQFKAAQESNALTFYPTKVAIVKCDELPVRRFRYTCFEAQVAEMT